MSQSIRLLWVYWLCATNQPFGLPFSPKMAATFPRSCLGTLLIVKWIYFNTNCPMPNYFQKWRDKSECAFFLERTWVDPKSCGMTTTLWVSSEPVCPSHDLLVAVVDTAYGRSLWNIIININIKAKNWLHGWSFLPEETSYAFSYLH